MNIRAGYFTLLTAAVLVISVLFIPASSGSPQTELDLIVENSTTVQINSDYVLTGNIHIKDNGVLIISYSKFTILQAHDHQYSVTVEGNGRLFVLYSTISSNARLNIVVKGNSTLLLDSSKLSYSGNLTHISQNTYSQILNSSLCGLNATFGGVGLTIKNTTILSSFTILEGSTVLIEDSTINEAIVTSGLTKLYDSMIPNFSVTNDGRAEIYRTLWVSVKDKIKQEIPNANLDAYRNLEGDTSTLVAHGKTDENGNCNLSLLTETYDAATYEGSHFFGNYLITASFGNINASASISFEPYEMSSGAGKTIEVTFEEIVMGDRILSSSPLDLHLVGNQTLIIENNSEIGFKLEGNILLENNASLHITNSSVLFFSRIISLKDSSMLIIDNSTLISSTTIYIQDRASVVLQESTASIQAIVGLKGNLTMEGTRVDGSIYTLNTNILAHNSEVQGDNIEVATSENASVSFENAVLRVKNTSFTIAKPDKFNFVNVSTNSIEFHSNDQLTVYNLTYTRIYTDTLLEIYNFLEVHATNGNNRSVANATVKVYRYEGSALAEVANGTTGVDGKVTFPLLSSKITGSSVIFVGNYRLSVIYNELALNLSIALTTSKTLVAHFVHPIVPPFEIQIQPNLPTTGHINETITVTGTVLYNHGPEVVANGSLQITIVETGEFWNTTTDANGKFSILINLPLKLGNYTVRIVCFEKEYGLSNATISYIDVVPYTQTQSIWEQPTVVYGTSTLVVVLILGLIIIAVRYINRKRVYYPVSHRNESELVKWAVETMHRSKEK